MDGSRNLEGEGWLGKLSKVDTSRMVLFSPTNYYIDGQNELQLHKIYKFAVKIWMDSLFLSIRTTMKVAFKYSQIR